jgi:hypothetical protein
MWPQEEQGKVQSDKTEPQKGNNHYRIARRRGILHRTQYNIHETLPPSRNIKKGNRTYITYMRKIATQYVHIIKTTHTVRILIRFYPLIF